MYKQENQDFLVRLEQHPALYEKFKELLALAENQTGEVLTADEAEEKLVREIRQLGRQLLQTWAESKHRQVEQKYERRLGMQHRGKKNSTG